MPPVSSRRSLLVLALGAVLVVGGGLLSIISFLSLLMIIAGSYGTQSTTIAGFVQVVLAPPVALITGIGVMLHRRWAWRALVAGLTVALGWSVAEAIGGLPSTAESGGSTFSLPSLVAAVSVAMLGLALLPSVRAAFRGKGQAIESGHAGPANGRVREVPARSFPAAEWREAPTSAKRTRATERMAVAAVVLILVAIAAAAGWQIAGGLETGALRIPTGRGAQSLTAMRAEEPVQFWMGIGLYGTAAAGCLGLALWILAHARPSAARRRSSGHG